MNSKPLLAPEYAFTTVRSAVQDGYVSIGIPIEVAYAHVNRLLVRTLTTPLLSLAAPFIPIVSLLQAALEKPWLWPIVALGSSFKAYVLGITALLVLALRRGSTIFARTWLSSVAAKPLLITPRLGSWALFLGYTRRLGKLRAVGQAASGYFGLPAEDTSGAIVLPDATGESLHERIHQALGPQQPVLIIGKGGSGKRTLLAR